MVSPLSAPQSSPPSPERLPSAPGANGGNELSDMFVKLLVAQIQNQNPLEPTDPAQYVSQFAQLAQTEALSNMSDLTNAGLGMSQSMLVVSLGSQVGSTVKAKADALDIGADAVEGSFTLKDATSDATVILTGPDGQQHKVALGEQKAGEVAFAIDPAALGLPPGHYDIKVETGSGEKPAVEIAGKLESVRVGADGKVILHVAGIGDVETGDITHFLGNLTL